MILSLVEWVFRILYLLIFIYVIASWFPNLQEHPSFRLIEDIVNPLIRPIRRVLHPYQRNLPIDFSPMVLMILLWFIEGFVLRLLLSMGF